MGRLDHFLLIRVNMVSVWNCFQNGLDVCAWRLCFKLYDEKISQDAWCGQMPFHLLFSDLFPSFRISAKIANYRGQMGLILHAKLRYF